MALDSSQVTAAGVCALLLGAPALESLSLARVYRVNWFDLFTAFARMGVPASRLTDMCLAGNPTLVDAAAARLCRGRGASPLAKLAALDVSACSSLTGAGVVTFMRTSPSLRVLLARNVRMTAAHVRTLSSTVITKDIRVLSLPNTLTLDSSDSSTAWSALCAAAQALVVLNVRGARGFGEDSAANASATLRVLDARGTALSLRSGGAGPALDLEPWSVVDAAAAVSFATAAALRAATAPPNTKGRVGIAVKRLGDALEAARALNFVLQCSDDDVTNLCDAEDDRSCTAIDSSALMALADSRRWWTRAARAAFASFTPNSSALQRSPTLVADDAAAVEARAVNVSDGAARTLQNWWPRARVRHLTRLERIERARQVFSVLSSMVLSGRAAREVTRTRTAARERVAMSLGLAWRARRARDHLSRLAVEWRLATATRLARVRARAVCIRFLYSTCAARRVTLTSLASVAALASRGRISALRLTAARAAAKAGGAAAAAVAAKRSASAALYHSVAAAAALQEYQEAKCARGASDTARLVAAIESRAAMKAVYIGEAARAKRGLAVTRIIRAFDVAILRRRDEQHVSRELANARARILVAVSLQLALRGNAARAKTRCLAHGARLAAQIALEATDCASRLIAKKWREVRDARVASAQQWCWFIDGQSGHLAWARTDGDDEPRWRAPHAVRALCNWPPPCACSARASVECAECWRAMCMKCSGVAHAGGGAAAHERRALRDAGKSGEDGIWPPWWPSDAAADAAASDARRGQGPLSRLQFMRGMPASPPARWEQHAGT